MPWGAVAGAVANYALSDSGGGGSQQNGGAGTQTQTKTPWSGALPWITSNMQQGQNLQQQYQNSPFNQSQLTAYGNMGAQSDYMRSLTPSLLNQMSNQPLGYDRSNPSARPKAYDFNAGTTGGGGATGAALGGLLGRLQGGSIGNYGAANPAPPAPVQQQGGGGAFTMGSDNFLNPTQAGARWTPEQAAQVNSALGQTGGGYGSYKVGMQPPVGTQAWADMQIYNQIMGLNVQPAARGLLGDAGNNSGNSIGGSPSADGSGGGAPGPW